MQDKSLGVATGFVFTVRVCSPRQASRWREEAQQLRLALEQSEQQCAHLQRHELPSAQEENTRARCIISQLETEVQAARDTSAAALAGRDAQLAELHAKVAQLTVDNSMLKQELAKNLQVWRELQSPQLLHHSLRLMHVHVLSCC